MNRVVAKTGAGRIP